MKQRLVVMNGQRIVQSLETGAKSFDQAKNVPVGRSGDIKPGVYNLYSALDASKKEQYIGQVIHADKNSIYQKVGINIIRHERSDFDKVPEIASVLTVSYNDQGRAVTSAAPLQQGRGMRR